MKIAFANLWDPHWQAGQVLLESIFASLKTLGSEAPAVALLVGPHTPPEHYQALVPYLSDVIKTPETTRPAKLPIHRRVKRWVKSAISSQPNLVAPVTLTEVLQRHQVSCFFSAAFGAVQPITIPYLTWIFDFQHQHLPDLFTSTERYERDNAFLEHAQAAALALCTSESVRQDFCQHIPGLAHKIRVFKQAPYIPPEAYDDEHLTDLNKYELPDRFFYLPNQFWVHKNHRAVIAALAILRKRAFHPYIVCTGSSVDHRHPGYFDDVIRLLAENGLRDQLIFLGVVARPTVFALMRRSICILNPTLFEGLGLSVVEGIGLGKRLLVSDLPVLREQPATDVVFFDPNQPEELADKLALIWQAGNPGPDLQAEAVARNLLQERQREAGRLWLDLCNEALQGSTSE